MQSLRVNDSKVSDVSPRVKTINNNMPLDLVDEDDSNADKPNSSNIPSNVSNRS